MLRGKLTYANVIATIALFVALGGASYAATNLPKNSVGTKQIKNKAITGAKIQNKAITGAKIQTGSLGTVPSASHAVTADSAAVATHATAADSATQATVADSAASATNAGNAAALGGVGAGQYLTATSALPSGKTETGVFSTGGGAANNFVPATVNFIPKAPTAPAADHLVYLNQEVASAPHCPGVGAADPGYLCAYGGAESAVAFNGFYQPTSTAETGSTTDGTTIFFEVTGTGAYVRGTWAYTAQ